MTPASNSAMYGWKKATKELRVHWVVICRIGKEMADKNLPSKLRKVYNIHIFRKIKNLSPSNS